MLASPATFRAALKSGAYEKAAYAFLMLEGQTRETALGRWADGGAVAPGASQYSEDFTGIQFSVTGPVTAVSPPKEQTLAGRNIASVRIADPTAQWRNELERNGFRDFLDGDTVEKKSVRFEFWYDYLYGINEHYTIQFYTGDVIRASYVTDSQDNRFTDLQLGGQFRQMNPDLSFTLTAEQQKARRDAGDTSLDRLQEAWNVKLGRQL